MSLMANFEFKKKYDLASRKVESERIRAKYPDRIPVICERASASSKTIEKLDKTKYLVPSDLTIGQFMYVVRRRIKLDPNKAIFLMIDNQLPASSELISSLYHNKKSDDGFLYLHYSGENTFG